MAEEVFPVYEARTRKECTEYDDSNGEYYLNKSRYLTEILAYAEEYTPFLIEKERKKLLNAPQKKIEDQSQSNDHIDEEIPF